MGRPDVDFKELWIAPMALYFVFAVLDYPRYGMVSAHVRDQFDWSLNPHVFERFDRDKAAILVPITNSGDSTRPIRFVGVAQVLARVDR